MTNFIIFKVRTKQVVHLMEIMEMLNFYLRKEKLWTVNYYRTYKYFTNCSKNIDDLLFKSLAFEK